MAAVKPIILVAGQMSQVNTAVTGGAGDAYGIPSLDVNGKLTDAMLPDSVIDANEVITTSEALSAGNEVNIYNSSGLKVRKADAANGYVSNGYVKAAFSSGASATVYTEGNNDALTGLTVGADYWLSTTAGGLTTTPPSTAGQIVQYIGRALTATKLARKPGPPITLA